MKVQDSSSLVSLDLLKSLFDLPKAKVSPGQVRPNAPAQYRSAFEGTSQADAQARLLGLASGTGDGTDPNAGYNGVNLSRADVFKVTDAAARKYDLPPEVLRAIALQESDATQWFSNGSAVANHNTDGSTDWGVMQLNDTNAWVDVDGNRARTDERYNIDAGARDLRAASDYWFQQKYGRKFSTSWYNAQPESTKKEIRQDLFRSYNGWLPDPSNAYPYEAKIQSGEIGKVPSSSPGTGSTQLRAPNTDLKRGDTGAEVEMLQRGLVKLGFMTQADMNTGPGEFGPRTEAAVKKFQQAKNLEPASGAVGPRTRKSLGMALNPLPAPAVDLRTGDTGEQVKTLQNALVKLGYMTKDQVATGPGEYGPKTTAAVKQFQSDWNLSPASGTLGPKTREALKKALSGTVPPSGGTSPVTGKISTVGQANAHMTTQWGPTASNSADGAPYGYSDCGPASAVMLASALGLIQHPSPAQAENAIDAMRDRALGYDSTYSQPTNEGQMSDALRQVGAKTEILNPDLGSVDAALKQGKMLLIAGDPWNGWGASMDARGEYLNHRDPGGHFCVVFGRQSDGKYLVGDPLSNGGAIAVTRDQLQSFFDLGGWNSGLVSVWK